LRKSQKIWCGVLAKYLLKSGFSTYNPDGHLVQVLREWEIEQMRSIWRNVPGTECRYLGGVMIGVSYNWNSYAHSDGSSFGPPAIRQEENVIRSCLEKEASGQCNPATYLNAAGAGFCVAINASEKISKYC
jgi:hypothetical protein